MDEDFTGLDGVKSIADSEASALMPIYGDWQGNSDTGIQIVLDPFKHMQIEAPSGSGKSVFAELCRTKKRN